MAINFTTPIIRFHGDNMFIIDPTEYFTRLGYTLNDFRQASGYALDWALTTNKNQPIAPYLDSCYAHGGGWQPLSGFELDESGILTYPGDPKLHPLWAITYPNGETIRMYEHAWVSIQQPDGAFEVSRMD